MRRSKEAQRIYDRARHQWLRANPQRWARRLKSQRARYHLRETSRYPNICQKCGKFFRCSLVYQRCCSLKCAHSGQDSPFWKGGMVKTGDGYLRIYHPFHPNVKGNHVLQHRLVMEHLLGRYLRRNEIVHHRNGNKLDNRPENLVVVSSSYHSKLHWKDGSHHSHKRH